MSMITTSRHNGAEIIKLNRGITNALNLELVNELTGVIRRIKDDPESRGLVLTSTNDKFFSIGFDLPHIYGLSAVDFEIFYRSFNQACLELYTLPKPTVAAITGHAVAGGCILALCCDQRLIANGRKFMGLNEIKLGVPVPYLADRVLHELVGVRAASEIMEIGEFYTAQRALEVGMVDQVLSQEKVLDESVKRACTLGEVPLKAFAMIKRNRVEPIEVQVLACLDEKTEGFLDCWYSDQARARLKEAIEKF
jgi:enoyl-CoA hydratase/carnithine racemase